jgi:hypothetical protein
MALELGVCVWCDVSASALTSICRSPISVAIDGSTSTITDVATFTPSPTRAGATRVTIDVLGGPMSG